MRRPTDRIGLTRPIVRVDVETRRAVHAIGAIGASRLRFML